ncbi:glycosyltransferase family 4 protein [Candidatus Gracilibacteria bacterium]|nr:glycosyltransferase family 4 protein [Candidatus Gracilibacteria bacterium]
MKIAIDASRYGHEEATGVEWYSFHIINELLKLGSEEITLYSRYHLPLKGVKQKAINVRRLWTHLGLSRELKKNMPDVLFVPSHVFPMTLPKKRVIMIHDVAFRYLKKSYSFFSYHYLNWSTKFAVKHATTILTPSEATKKDLVKIFKCDADKIEVVQHGFSLVDVAADKGHIFEYFALEKYFLFVGRLESKKNLERLVKAFAKMDGNYKLVLAGKRGVGFDKLLKLVNKLGLLGRVVMPGYVTEGEKRALYENCEAFVFPSLYEGFGLPILEAFHYGKAVMCSDCSSLPEVAGRAAIFVDPESVDSIKNGMEKVVKQKEELVDLGRERLKLFSWKVAGEKTYNILKNG